MSKTSQKRSAPKAPATKTPAFDQNPSFDQNPAIDQNLIDRMTGRLGDRLAIETCGRQIQTTLSQQLETAFLNATGLTIDVQPGDIRLGRRRDLMETLGPGAAYCDATIRGWSTGLGYLCGVRIVIALVECLLGGSDPDALDISGRPLSGIELDMSLVVFEQLNDTLKSIVHPEPEARALVAKPLPVIPHADDDLTENFHAAALTLTLEFGTVTAPLILILPQSVMLKTKVAALAKQDGARESEQAEWAQRLSRRVVRSEVKLQARIALEPMALGDISRLKAGDLLAFADTGDIKVTLGANGKDLFFCALGRSAQRYMVKVENEAGPDEDWKNEFA